MVVKELIAFLEKLNPEMKVFIMTDAEGNGCNSLDEGEVNYYCTENKPHEIEPIDDETADEYDDKDLASGLFFYP